MVTHPCPLPHLPLHQFPNSEEVGYFSFAFPLRMSNAKCNEFLVFYFYMGIQQKVKRLKTSSWQFSGRRSKDLYQAFPLAISTASHSHLVQDLQYKKPSGALKMFGCIFSFTYAEHFGKGFLFFFAFDTMRQSQVDTSMLKRDEKLFNPLKLLFHLANSGQVSVNIFIGSMTKKAALSFHAPLCPC